MSAARRPGSGVEAASAKAVRKPPQALAGTSFGRAVPEPDGASRQVLRQRTFPARFCVLSRKCLSGGFVQPGTHFSTTEAALPRRTPVRFADWIEPKQGERRRVAGRLDTESPSLRDLGLPVVALDRSSDFWRAPLEAITWNTRIPFPARETFRYTGGQRMRTFLADNSEASDPDEVCKEASRPQPAGGKSHRRNISLAALNSTPSGLNCCVTCAPSP